MVLKNIYTVKYKIVKKTTQKQCKTPDYNRNTGARGLQYAKDKNILQN